MKYPVYCINLKERLERKKYVENEFSKIDIQPTDVIFLDFYRHKKGGRYGCYDSHMKVWNDFYTNHPDKEMCIIFEDDVEMTENSKLYLKKAISFVEKNKDNIDILFLHDTFVRYSEEIEDRDKNKKCIDDKYFINGYGFLTHAYIVTRRYIKTIIYKNNNVLPKPSKIHFDLDINMQQKSILYSKNIYYCKKSVFIQKNCESDNYLNTFDKTLRKIYGTSGVVSYIGINLLKNIKLLLDDYKAQRVFMRLNKIYVK
jgi:GR25 family glycosyltransferase involved in LPS biosynthesis